MKAELGVLVRCLEERHADGPTDRELLHRYATARDEDAFAALVERHGPLVWGVCRRALQPADAEDVYQATFLVLARKAGAPGWRASVAAWLHAVATRLARKVRGRPRRTEPLAVETPGREGDPLDGLTARELLVALDEEVAALPANEAGAVLLCLVQGRTQDEAARLLGVSLSAVRRRLRQGRERLALRLRRRGLSLVVPALPAGVPPAVLPAAALSARVLALAEAVAQSASAGLRGALAMLVLVGLGVGLAASQPPAPEPAPVVPPTERPAGAIPADRDRQGDPLPPGAVARLGTVRLRVGMKPATLAFAPGGRLLATVAQQDGLRLWEVPSGKELGHLPGHPTAVQTAAFSPDGKRLAMVAGGVVTLHAVADNPPALGRAEARIQLQEAPARFATFRPDGSLLLGVDSGRVAVYDAAGKEVRRFGDAGVGGPPVFALSPDGKLLAVAEEQTVSLWDVTDGTRAGVVPGLVRVPSLAFSLDGKLLALGDVTNTIRLWDVAAKKTTARLVGVKAPGQSRGVGDTINSLVFAPDGATLYSVGDYGDGTVRVWDAATGKQTGTFQGRHGDGHLLALAPDGKTLAVAGTNGTVRLWDTRTGKEADAVLGTQGVVTAVAVAPSGSEVAVAGNDGVIYLWDRTGKPLRQWRAHERQVARLVYAPGGGLYSVGAYEPARLWNTATGAKRAEVAGATGSVRGVNSLTVSPDGKTLAVAANDRTLQLVEAATGKSLRTLAKDASIDQAAFAPDGKTLATGGFNKHVHLWDVASGEEKWAVPLPVSVSALAFAPDGEAVAVGTYGRAVLVLEAATGQLVRTLDGRADMGRALAYSPDGRLLAVGGDLPEVALYEVATGLLVRRLAGHRGAVWSLAFTPDGRELITGSFDGTALVWDVAGRDLARNRVAPPTEAELSAWWGLLGKPAVEGHDALLHLANAPDAAAALARSRLVRAGADKAVARWLAELDSDDFDTRERASTELGRLGRGVEAELRRTLAATQSAEVAGRIRVLLDRLGDDGDPALRGRRVVAVLELANTPRTREALKELAQAGISDDLRRWSRQALARLGE